MSQGSTNRWIIAGAGVVMQIALGAVYAWSVFRTPLTSRFQWTIPEVTLAFTICIFTVGWLAFAGGLWMQARGPRIVGIAGGLLYGVGVMLAYFSDHGIAVLYLTYGFIGGAGIGLSYIVPIATLVKWFPDRRGFISGIAVTGFGAGALLTAPIATHLIRTHGVLTTFAILGVAYLILVVGSSLFMVNPPPGYAPAGWTPPAVEKTGKSDHFAMADALGTWQWYALWATLFLNVVAGISIISQAAPMVQEITHSSTTAAAAMVGIIAIGNGAGRFLWAWLSDAIGRARTFTIMFLLQAVLFAWLPRVSDYALFTAICFVVLLCYGGGFGTMPAFCADYFGTANVGSIYGLMLTAWGFGSAFGPLLIANIRQSTGHYSESLYIIAGIMLVSAVLPFVMRPPVNTAVNASRI